MGCCSSESGNESGEILLKESIRNSCVDKENDSFEDISIKSSKKSLLSEATYFNSKQKEESPIDSARDRSISLFKVDLDSAFLPTVPTSKAD